MYGPHHLVGMFRNYLLIAWRTLKRDKLFAALNIIGLAIGIVACMLIYIYVQDEVSFDAHHAKADRIYRIQAHYKFGDTKDDFGITPFPIMEALLWASARSNCSASPCCSPVARIRSRGMRCARSRPN